MTQYSVEELIHKADLAIRPYALYLNPDDLANLLPFQPDLSNRVLIVQSELVEKGKAYLIDRKQLEFETYEIGNRPHI